MKNKVLWIIIITLAILLLIGFLYSQGIINVKWEWLTIILAGLAGPFKFIGNIFTGKSTNADKVYNKHLTRIEAEKEHRIKYDKVITEKEQKITELESKVNNLQQKIDNIELQQQDVENEVNQITNVNDLQDAFMEAYGDEH